MLQPMNAVNPFPQMEAGWGFSAYHVASYDEEIVTVKKWLADRLSFLDRNIERFDKDWQPRIQELKEKKMPQFPGGFFPFPFAP